MHFFLRATVVALIIAGAPAGSSAQSAAAAATAPAVIVTKVRERDITPRVKHVGRVEAVSSVDLRARVSGVLEKVEFQEGRAVGKGARLFVIEQEPYELVVEQRSADLAGAEATLRNAKAQYARTRELRQRNAVSQAEVDASKADEAIAEANVLQARAALRAARIDLGYTEIFAPIGGQISRSVYSAGNLVGPESNALARVTSVDPIYVTIAVSEKNLLWARRRGIDLDNPRVEPVLTLSDGEPYDHVGSFDYLDTQVNRNTDTVMVRAVFANPQGLLVPGQFVRVTMRQKDPQTALVVPQASVQEDRNGTFVLVVREDNTVEQRRVVLGERIDEAWAVRDGLKLDERVILQGLQKVRPGMPVKPQLGGV